MYLLTNAIKKVGEDRTKIREALIATKGLEGVLGTYSFTADDEGLRGGPMATIKNGEPQMLKMITVNEQTRLEDRLPAVYGITARGRPMDAAAAQIEKEQAGCPVLGTITRGVPVPLDSRFG